MADTDKKGVSSAAAAVIAAITFVIGIYVGTVISGMSAGVSGPAPQRVAAPQSMPQAATEGGQVSEGMAREIAALEVRASSNPDDLGAWIKLGHLYFDTAQFDNAIRAYTRALELDPTDPDVWTDLGVMYRRIDRPSQAIESFDKAIQADPTHETARFNKGVVLMHDLGDEAGAVAAWKELLEVNPQATAPNGVPVGDMIGELEKARTE